ncbi:hypothetical protein KC357_g8873 [Hortaea werneckii]|nr:hypothetical protein KC357_g8873 [Hortaea werneckii]
MKVSVVQLLATATALSYGSPLAAVDGVPEGYELVPAKWTGEIVPGEGPVTLEGDSGQSLMAQILSINPNYIQDKENTTAHAGVAARQIGGCGGRAISKNIQCGVPYQTVHGSDISSGLVYLSNLEGCLTLGGNSCFRYSCSYNSGIFVCNDNNGDIQAPYQLISDIGGDMFGQCASFNDGADFTAQAFTDENWNVLLQRSLC